MDTKQAKFILHSWRVSGADADDPHFTEALHLLDRDLDLADWFAREQLVARSHFYAIKPRQDEIVAARGFQDQDLAGLMVTAGEKNLRIGRRHDLGARPCKES